MWQGTRGKAICSEPGRAGTKDGDPGRGLQRCEDRNLRHREMKLERVAGASLVVSGREESGLVDLKRLWGSDGL